MSAAAFSYASFSRGAGGWQVGELLGPLDEGRMRSLLGAVPTQLSDGTPVPTYPDRAERARLVRRFAWLPAPWDPQVKVFFSSVPAGSDATGRPGNVFTYVSVCGEPGIPVSAAVSAMFSPDIPTPSVPGDRGRPHSCSPRRPVRSPGSCRSSDGWDEAPALPEIRRRDQRHPSPGSRPFPGGHPRRGRSRGPGLPGRRRPVGGRRARRGRTWTSASRRSNAPSVADVLSSARSWSSSP